MHVIVVGGGLVGSGVAWELARRGVEVAVMDREDSGRATSAGAGIISGWTVGSENPAYLSLAVRADAYYHDVVHALGAEAVGYGRSDIVYVAMPGDEDAFFRTRKAWAGRPGVVERDPDEVVKQFPVLGPVVAALGHEGAARVDGRLLEARLKLAARDLGVRIVRQNVQALAVDEGRVRGVVTAEGRFGADAVVVAAGAWSGQLLSDVGVRVPVVPHRGQIIHVDLPVARGQPWPIAVGFRGHYVLPWPDGHIVAGATRESDSGFAPVLTAGGQAEVLREMLRVAPGLATAHVREWRVGLRPASGDGLPLLGPVSAVPGLFVVTGHGAGGLLLGPLSARLVAEAVVGTAPVMDLGPFLPDRPYRPENLHGTVV
jgi:D-amino-acid dehydrogenase